MRTKDIIKGVIYDRGKSTMNGETRHFALIAMVVASDRPIVTSENPEYVVMGACHLMENFEKLVKYQCPHKLGNIETAILDISTMIPDDLEEL